jgi:DNA gyrase subunit B
MDSAGGSAKDGRDRNFQAIYSLRGKPLNTNDKDMTTILDPRSNRFNKEIADLVTVIGTGTGDNYNDKKRKYNKITIMSDADIDGSHIQVLLFTFFLKHMPQLISDGHLYLAMSPLYRVKENKKFIYMLDDVEYNSYIAARMLSIYNIKNSEGNNITKKQLEKLLRDSNSYYNEVIRLSAFMSIDLSLLETFLMLKDCDTKTSVDFINENIPGLKAKNIKDVVHITGTYDEKYYELPLDEEFWKEASHTSDLQSELNGFTTITLEEKTSGNTVEYYAGEGLKLLYDKSTPKSRTRLKGLGESDPHELWETTMNPETRLLTKVTMDDFEKSSNIIEVLMGKQAELRRDFLEIGLPADSMDLDI